MFDVVRSNPRIAQFILALITVPFAFWGVDAYFHGMGSGKDVASVGDSKIPAAEFQRALREQQDRLRPLLGNRDPALLDSPKLRESVLDQLVNRRLLALYVAKSRLTIADPQLRGFIMSQPELQDNGQFSRQRYEDFVRAKNMSEEGFEAQVRQDLSIQQPLIAVADGALPGSQAADRWVAAQMEQREISAATLSPDQYAGQVKLAPDAVKKFYDENHQRFEMPEQVKVAYLVLSQEQMAEQATVSDAEVSAWYKSHPDRYVQPEERRASHILILAAKGAPAADLKAAQAKAEKILAEVNKAPGEFAKLAKENSQDPGSADKGGDLGWFGRGRMVKPFEDAVFSLKEGQISGIVQSDFGFHIIELTGIHPAKPKPFDEVRGEIAAELKEQAAAKKYAEAAEGFSNTVYEQADSLQPAADKYGLKVQQSDWLVRGAKLPEPFANAKLLASVFADDAVKSKHNTEAVEVAPNTLVAARVVDYKPAAMQPLAAVSAAIEKLLVQREAAKLAVADGEAKLARLAKGESLPLAWDKPRSVTRVSSGLPAAAASAIFRAGAGKLPAYAGVATKDGYALFRISKVTPASLAGNDQRVQALRQQYAQIVADEEFNAWMASLKERYPVEINKAVLEAKQEQ